MTEQGLEVPSPTALRDALETAVVRDLLGPAGGPEEELDEAPRERYLLGMLAPRRQVVVQQTLDELAVAGEDAAEDGPDESRAPAATTMFPSSFGLTFAVDSRAPALRVVARWGHYERTGSSAPEGAGPPRVWKRRQVQVVLDPLGLAAGTQRHPVADEHPGVEVHGGGRRPGVVRA